MGHRRTERTWQEALIARHPRLFTLSGNGRPSVPGYPFVGDGWRDLVERAAERIEHILAAVPSASVTIVETKSKFATLRMYWNGARLTKAAEIAVADAIALAEARSGCTCETCGAEGVLHQVGGQVLTACSRHALGTPVPIEPGWENIHLLRGFRNGRTAILVCRRYLRETDEFVDVDHSSLGIDE